MARSIKAIYRCTCLEELTKEAQGAVNNIESALSAKTIINTADKLYTKAEESQLIGDEELTYLYFYRFLEAMTKAQKRDDFKKDKTYYEKLIPPSKTKQALLRLEILSDSLQKRYSLKKEIENCDSVAREKEINDAVENQKYIQTKKGTKDEGSLSSGNGIKTTLSTINGIVKANGVDKPGSESGGITPTELKTLLEQKTKRMLFVDCRDKVDFTNNHINHSHCVCIPPTAVQQGMSANRILKILKDSIPESYMDWSKRGSFDYIILYDWNSSFDNRNNSLKIVYDALTKWDQECKSTKVVVVQGGMKNMYYMYPNLLTNPQTVNSTNAKVNGSSNDLPDLRKLESISYPDLDDTPKNPRSSEPRDTSVNNGYNTDVPRGVVSESSTHYSVGNADVHNVPKNSIMASIDRSTKPRFSSSQTIPNGVGNEPARMDVVKTDDKAKEYSQKLDEVIESTRHVVKIEEELNELKDRSITTAQIREYEAALKTKEVEAEGLRKQLEKRNEETNMFKAKYEAVLRQEENKAHLPKLRPSSEEDEIRGKQSQKENLDEMVQKLRQARKEAEEKERLKKLEQEKGTDPPSKLPPIPNSNASPAPKGNNGKGTTQLPIINTSVPTGVGANASPSIKPSSSTTSATSLRPTSQEPVSTLNRQKLKDENSEPPRSSGLKRSHSHPNIAQSHDDDLSDEPSGAQPPRINRGLKPSGHRALPQEIHTPRRFARNFEVVSSTEKSKTGLKNLGNTCYMNSIIQCLSHTIKLVEYLRSEEYMREWHPGRSPTKGEATEELAAAVKQMHSGHRSISLLDLKSAIGKHHRSFRGYEQQDSHEFITILLDWLHEEMNRVPEKTPLKEQKNDGLTDGDAAMRAWDDYKRSNNSKISELFCGQQKSCVTCGICSRQSVTFEPFFILSVPIPSSGKKCDIQQCIDFYTTEEELTGWNCVHCRKKVRATKKIDLWRLPPYLIIHLQRFYFDGYWKKRLTEVDFPVENLNLNNKVLGYYEKCPSNDYQLYGVSNHYGSMDGGHYTAYCRVGHPNGSWLKFDDQEVCPINSRDVPTAAAYIMFYQNRHC